MFRRNLRLQIDIPTTLALAGADEAGLHKIGELSENIVDARAFFSEKAPPPKPSSFGLLMLVSRSSAIGC